MKRTNLALLLLIIFTKSFAQDSTWKKNVFNELLTFNLPAGTQYSQSSYVKGYGGAVGANYYGFQFYDTVFLEIKTEKEFETSLTGFMSGRSSDPLVKKYNITVVDTTINKTKGLMATFLSTDSMEAYKQIYGFVTIANNKFYYFYAYTPFAKEADEEVNFFFRSIIFNTQKIKEKAFKLTKINLVKNAE